MSNKNTYIEFCNNNDDIPLFHQPWWLDIMTNSNWDVVISIDKNNNVKAVFPYSVKKKYGMSFILQPVLTPQLGILYFYPNDLVKQTSIYSFQNKHAKVLIEQLPKGSVYESYKFVPDFNNWLPFFNKGYEQSTRYTYILNDIKNHEAIYNGFSNTIKRQIKEAQGKVTITEEDNICLVYTMVKESLKRQNTKFALTREILKSIEKKYLELNNGKVLIARDENGKVNAGVFVIWDRQKAYLLGVGTDLEFDKSNATKLLIWQAIKHTSQYVDKFDFEGSMLPGVERLYRSFGGKQMQYFEIKKYRNKFYKLLFTLLNK